MLKFNDIEFGKPRGENESSDTHSLVENYGGLSIINKA